MVNLLPSLVVLFLIVVIAMLDLGIVFKRLRGAPLELNWKEKLTLLISLAGGLLFFYSWLFEPYSPEIVRLSVYTEKLPPTSSPFRLVLLSDMHSDPKPRLETKLRDLIRPLKPNAILFAGDAINSKQGIPVFKRVIKELREIAPIYAVRGNWEVWWFAKYQVYENTGVELLEAEAMNLNKENSSIWISGFPVLPGSPLRHKARYLELAKKSLAEIPQGAFTVFLHHFPEVGALGNELGADLSLSGDTHGGQIRLPLIGPLVRISRFGNYVDMGTHQIADGTLYVNRGIGEEGGSTPRLRFLCRPEITLIEILPEGDPK